MNDKTPISTPCHAIHGVYLGTFESTFMAKFRTEKSLDKYIMSYLNLNQNIILSHKAPLVYTQRNKHAQTPLDKSISCSQDSQPLEILLGTSCYSFPCEQHMPKSNCSPFPVQHLKRKRVM